MKRKFGFALMAGTLLLCVLLTACSSEEVPGVVDPSSTTTTENSAVGTNPTGSTPSSQTTQGSVEGSTTTTAANTSFGTTTTTTANSATTATTATNRPTTTTTATHPTTTTTGPIIEANGSFYDDFTNGISSDLWYISELQWGGGNNGVLSENVNYTADGTVVLTANGDLYEGQIGTKNGKRTGACLITKASLGPGSYEVRMKVLPRLGTCTAMWTYFNDGRNHEIDIELPGNTQTFKYSLFTNWLTEYNNLSQHTIPNYYHNDGEWHTYRFDWHTNPQRIDYYVDGKLEVSATQKVPTAAGHFWVGVWFPQNWCGNPDFETAHMLVDYVKYTAYDEPYEKTNASVRPTASLSEYPSAPIELPVNNYVANGSFNNNLSAWTTSGSVSVVAGEDGKALSLGSNSASASQRISSVNSGAPYRLTVDARVAGSGDKANIKVESLAKNGSTVLGTQNFTMDSTAFSTRSFDFTLAEGAYFMRITLTGENGTVFDNLYVTQPNRGDF